jgi:AcrR family transcriptional regulator
MDSGFSWQSPSAQLVMEAALDILIEVGYDGLTMAEVKDRAGAAGRALDESLDVDALVGAALGQVRLLEAPTASGSLRSDLQLLVDPWRRPRTHDELVIAAVLSAAEWHPGLKPAVLAAFDRPVAQAVGTVVARALPEPVDPGLIQTLSWLLRGLMLERLRSGARSAVDLDRLVDFLMAGLGQASRPAGSEGARP